MPKVLSPSNSFLGGLVGGLISGNAHVGRYSSDRHGQAFVLKLSDPLYDLFGDVGARSSLRLGYRPYSCLIVRMYGYALSFTVLLCVSLRDL